MKRHWIIVSTLLLLVAATHWMLPRDDLSYHAMHVTMRKAFLLPVVLAAIWFTLPGAIATALAASLLYLPHVVWQWSGQTHENINQVGELATLWVVALVCGWLVSEEKIVIREKANANEGALLALIGTLDARKQKRKHHSMRVFAYASRIARELDLPREDLEVLAQASVLHDLGMISVPDRVLLKPGALTDDEWALIHKHPTIGYRIVRRVPAFDRVAEVVHAHHERFDGSGYPRGLAGESIPFLARVFSIADALDAIMTDRRYGSALPLSEACQVIADGAGSQFDPNLVAVFKRIPGSEWSRILRELDMRMSEMEGMEEHEGEVLDAQLAL